VNVFKKTVNFIREVRQELAKVAWSNRQELLGSTFVVITITAITAVFIFVIDFALARALSLLFR